MLASGRWPLCVFAGNEFADRLAFKGAEAHQHSEWTMKKLQESEAKPGRCRGEVATVILHMAER